MKLFQLAAAVAGAAYCFCPSPAAAQIPDDVAVEIATESMIYKAGKKGGGSVQFSTFTIFSSFSGLNLKGKAGGVVNFYVSSDSSVDPSDRLITSKKLNLKAMMPKVVKVKANLANEDRGKYILAEVISPQDGYAANNVNFKFIPLNAF